MSATLNNLTNQTINKTMKKVLAVTLVALSLPTLAFGAVSRGGFSGGRSFSRPSVSRSYSRPSVSRPVSRPSVSRPVTTPKPVSRPAVKPVTPVVTPVQKKKTAPVPVTKTVERTTVVHHTVVQPQSSSWFNFANIGTGYLLWDHFFGAKPEPQVIVVPATTTNATSTK